MISKLTSLLCSALLLASPAVLHAAQPKEWDLGAMVQPVPMQAKFSDPDYFIWCGAPTKGADGRYHLFYSRWPVSKGFHPGWALWSEIAYAVADNPLGPYKHVNVALPARGREFWDGTTTHNPNILQKDGKFYLFYMGNTGDGKSYPMHRNNQRIGVAVAEKPEGPWKRFDKPIVTVSDDKTAFDSLCVNNPAAAARPDGGILLIYKAVECVAGKEMGGKVRYGAALADRPEGPYKKVLGRIFESEDADAGKHWMLAEDPFIWFSRRHGDRYYAVARDVVGKFTGSPAGIALFQSGDGLHWKPAAHPKVIANRYAWADGSMSITQLERPALLLDGETPVALFGAADGYMKGGRISSNVQIPLKEQTSRRVMVPRVTGEWIHVYKPEADIFPGPDSPRFKAGQRYDDWQVNDHAILKGPDGRWHAFGITHPAVADGEPNPHEAEWLLFHAAAPAGSLKQHGAPGRWQDQPKVLPPARRPNEIREIHSPFIVHHGGHYWMFYGCSPIRYATSTDLWSWQPRGELFRQEGSARDPSVMCHDGVFYMSYTTRQSILVRTSRDLLHWSDPAVVFTLDPGETGGPESPTLLALHGGFYLIWCRWDAKLSGAGVAYQNRSFVYYSDTPLNFNDRAPVAELPGHAPELFQDEDGDWWISSAERPFRGVSIAPLKWETQNKTETNP